MPASFGKTEAPSMNIPNSADRPQPNLCKTLSPITFPFWPMIGKIAAKSIVPGSIALTLDAVADKGLFDHKLARVGICAFNQTEAFQNDFDIDVKGQ